jgi:hypothetical protein
MSSSTIPGQAAHQQPIVPRAVPHTLSRAQIVRLVRYLQACGGRDVHEFVGTDFSPDVVAARAFSEGMRAQLDAADPLISIEQYVHRVIVSLHLPSFA